jgi:hypothetical protein
MAVAAIEVESCRRRQQASILLTLTINQLLERRKDVPGDDH